MRAALLATAVLAAGALVPALAGEPVPVDGRTAPWDAIVKVQTNLATKCTGALVAPARVITAAHCLYNPRTQAMLPAVSLHVLVGYSRGEWLAHHQVERIVLPRGHVAGKTVLGADWAVLTLAAPAAVEPLPLNGLAPRLPAPASLAGFRRDRAHILMADLDCRILGTTGDGEAPLLAHDCHGIQGLSGAPLLVREGAGWAVAGITVAMDRRHHDRGYAVPSRSFAAAVLKE